MAQDLMICRLFALLFAASMLGATEITLKSGAVFSGVVVSQTDNFFILESEGSRINIAKSVVARIDGVPYIAESAPAPTAGSRTPLSQGAGYRFILGAEVAITLGNGTEFLGRILSENENFIILQVKNSRVTIAKAMIDQVDGRKISLGQAPSSPLTAALSETPPPGPAAAEKQPHRAAPLGKPEAVSVAPAQQAAALAGAMGSEPVARGSAQLSAATGPAAGVPAASAAGQVISLAPPTGPAPPPRPAAHEVKEAQWIQAEAQPAPPASGAAPGTVVIIAPPSASDSAQALAPAALARPDAVVGVRPRSQGPSPSSVTIIDRRYDDSASTPAAAALLAGTDTSLSLLMDRLRSRVPERRMAAVVTLGLLGERAAPAADLLVGLLTDTALYVSSGNETTPALKSLSAPTSVSDQAARALARIGAPACRIVVRALRDPNWVIRAQAAFVLGEMKAAEGIRPLVDALRDTSLVVCDVAVEALVKNGDPRPLFAVLRSRDVEQKKYAIEAMARMRDIRAVEPLIRALADKDSYVREKAAYALGEIRDARAIDALCTALSDNISFVRANAVEALGKIGDPRVMGKLNAALKDPSSFVQEKAMAVAKQFAAAEFKRYKENTVLLVEALKDANPQTREKAAQTLWVITGKDYGADYNQWRLWLNTGAVAADSLARPK